MACPISRGGADGRSHSRLRFGAWRSGVRSASIRDTMGDQADRLSAELFRRRANRHRYPPEAVNQRAAELVVN